MKLAILSDFHLGYERFYEDSFENAERALRAACEKADALLIAGDMFDARIPKPEVLARALRMFRQASAKKWEAKIIGRDCAPIIAIHGTHERRSKELVNPIQLMESAGLLANAHMSQALLELEGEKVAIQGLGGVPEEWAKGALAAADFKPIEGAFNIFAFHQMVEEFSPVEEKFLEISELPPHFDIYVCGHMHAKKIERIGGKLIMIPGSTLVTQMREEEQAEKGFFIFDTRKKTHDFIPIETRKFITSTIELSSAGIHDAEEKCRKAIEDVLKQKFTKPPVIKIKLTGTLAKGLGAGNIDARRLASEFNGRAIVEIESSLDEASISSKLAALKKSHEERKNMGEMGMTILKDKLKESGFALKIDAEELFSLLSKKKTDEALKKITEK